MWDKGIEYHNLQHIRGKGIEYHSPQHIRGKGNRVPRRRADKESNTPRPGDLDPNVTSSILDNKVSWDLQSAGDQVAGDVSSVWLSNYSGFKGFLRGFQDHLRGRGFSCVWFILPSLGFCCVCVEWLGPEGKGVVGTFFCSYNGKGFILIFSWIIRLLVSEDDVVMNQVITEWKGVRVT